MTRPTTARGYLPTLDGWRALAILFVLLGHDRVYRLGPWSTAWVKSHAERGVEIFFAISGLLICSRLLEEERLRGRIDLRGFYLRRVCRIQPAALAYLATIGVLMLFRALDRQPREMLYALLLVRNYLPLQPSLQSWYTAHYWSLSVEEHFYLFLPGFLALVRRHRATVLLAMVAAIELWRVAVLNGPRFQFGWLSEFHTDLAVGGILLSAGIAVLLVRPAVRAFAVHYVRPWAALLVTASVWIAVELHQGRADYFAVLCTFPLLVVSTMLHPGSLTGRVLEWAPLRYIGRISYSLYLWQMLFFTFYPGLPWPRWAALAYVQQTPLRYLAVALASVASFYWIEKPFIRLGHRLARPAVPDRSDFEHAPRNPPGRSVVSV